MNKEIEIPEGYEAKIDGNKVVFVPKENEDERIRKEIVGYLNNRVATAEETELLYFKRWIAYLKKQKEAQVAEWRLLSECSDIPDGHYVVGAFGVGDIRLGVMAHGKFIGVNGDRTQPSDVFYIPNANERFVYPDPKPAEWSDNFEENIRILLHDKLTWHSEDGSMSSTVFIDDKTLKDIISGIWFYVGKEALKYPNKELSQPNWSEEDETVIDCAVEVVEKAGLPSLAASLKSLRPQQISQPNINHTVWHNASEEKPTKLPIIHIWYHGNRVSAVVAHENISLQAELDDINFQPDDKWAYVEDLLNIQPHWKPSKEQMDALEDVLEAINNKTNLGSLHLYKRGAIGELYQQLKKL